MSPRPFLLRLIIPFAVVMILIVITCGVVIYWAGQETVHRQQIADLHRLAELTRTFVRGDETEISPERKAQLDGVARVLDTRVTIIDGRGIVLYDSEASPKDMENHNARPEVMEARRRGEGSSVRLSGTIHEQSVYVAELVDPAQPAGMVVRLSYPKRTWVVGGTPTWVVVGAAVASSLLMIVLLSVMLQRQWIGPVRALARAAERMAGGEWQLRAETRGADDVRFFCGKLNVLASQAEKQLADLRGQRSDLQALVDSLPDPILASDGDQKIVLMNAPAAQLLEISPHQAIGRKVVGVVNDAPVLELMDAMNDGRSSGAAPLMQREIRLVRNGQKLTFAAVFTRTAAGGLLVVLRDITELSAAVQMKTDFVANASHELRTPIAAIKIAFETLAEVYAEDPQQTARCVQIIGDHLTRLEEMLRDLLDLSRVESGDLETQIKPVRAVDLFASLRATMQAPARQKNIDLHLTATPSELSEFNSDPRLLNLVLKNLVENSIKYTPSGGRVTVSVDARSNGHGVAIAVADTGIGIAPEHIDRVFERFYQVDAARSSAAGRGTGLGLAIVKHAIHALGGEVKIDSKLGTGTTVTCSLSGDENPKSQARSTKETPNSNQEINETRR